MNFKNSKIKADAHNEKKKLSYQRIAIILTFGTLLAYIVVSIFQGIKTRETLKLTERSINLADSNFIIENRAWVGVSQQGFDPNMFVYVKNFGKTPAESLCIGHTTLICNTPPINRPQIIMEKPTSLSPSEIGTRIDFTQKYVREKIVGNCYYGIITYTDIHPWKL